MGRGVGRGVGLVVGGGVGRVVVGGGGGLVGAGVVDPQIRTTSSPSGPGSPGGQSVTSSVGPPLPPFSSASLVVLAAVVKFPPMVISSVLAVVPVDSPHMCKTSAPSGIGVPSGQRFKISLLSVDDFGYLLVLCS